MFEGVEAMHVANQNLNGDQRGGDPNPNAHRGAYLARALAFEPAVSAQTRHKEGDSQARSQQHVGHPVGE